MSILEILQFPDPVLRARAADVEKIDDRIRKLAADMIETMHHAEGVGLAAPQVGESIRMVVIDTSAGENPDEILILINPVIVQSDGEASCEEGCLSVPELRERVTRAERVKVQGYDLAGRAVEVVGEELLAIAIQHELDHLEG
ncbi:peptide deformylase, partial [bacterium]